MRHIKNILKFTWLPLFIVLVIIPFILYVGIVKVVGIAIVIWFLTVFGKFGASLVEEYNETRRRTRNN